MTQKTVEGRVVSEIHTIFTENEDPKTQEIIDLKLRVDRFIEIYRKDTTGKEDGLEGK